jgi:hypothetical protein
MSNSLNQHVGLDTKQIRGTLDRCIVGDCGGRISLESDVAQMQDGCKNLHGRSSYRVSIDSVLRSCRAIDILGRECLALAA